MTHVERITLIVSLCDYSVPHIIVSGSITAPNRGTAAHPNNRKI